MLYRTTKPSTATIDVRALAHSKMPKAERALLGAEIIEGHAVLTRITARGYVPPIRRHARRMRLVRTVAGTIPAADGEANE
jgi:hypothetical protein